MFLSGLRLTSFRPPEPSFAIGLASFQLISISARSALNVLRQVLVGLPLFLLPTSGTLPLQCVLSDLLRNVGYVQLVTIVNT